MPDTAYQIDYYQQEDGVVPFNEWLNGLRDATAVARVRIRLSRLRLGLFGLVKPLGDGITEVKIDYGPGYRVYYAISGNKVILLLSGGDKTTQRKDIATAKRYWKNYKGE